MSNQHPNERLITSFYQAFAEQNSEAMIACYHPTDARFSDPVFQDLSAPELFAMWTMLTKRAADFHLTFSEVEANDTTGSARWEARYLFSKTGRNIHNKIKANFVFRDGKIVQHRDDFDLWAWAGMALGPVGKLLGWTPLLQGTIRKSARKELDAFMAKTRASAGQPSPQ